MAALEAYAGGINAHMSNTSQGLTPEFTLLGINPRTMAASGAFWEPQDSVGWALMMAPDLGGIGATSLRACRF